MTENQSNQPRPDGRFERNRITALSSALLVVAAVIGSESLASAASPIYAGDRISVVAVRTLAAARAGGLESATGLGWTAMAIFAVLLIRRVAIQSQMSEALPVRIQSVQAASMLSRQRRKHFQSSRSGGLYGP